MAASAKEVITELQDKVECPVCLDQFKEPRSLPCQHSFCTECLQGLVGTGRNIRCPCCNKETPVPNGVQQLPVDFKANKQLEILSKYQKANVASGAEAAVVVAPEAVSPQDSLDQRCPVCAEIPTVSKNLSCGHRLCESCVYVLLPVGGSTLHCPTCYCLAGIGTSLSIGLHTQSPQRQTENVPAESRLTFHPRCGKYAVIHANRITAHRKDPQKSLGNALVLTSKHLKPDELFEVRLDKKLETWASSIKMGVTTHSPTESALSTHIAKLGPGTWYMMGNRVWGKLCDKWSVINTCYQSLDKVKVGDRVGIQRRANGNLHFYINGADLGVAASDVPADVYGVVELYGEAGQVTIMDTSADLRTISDSPQSGHGGSFMGRIRRNVTLK